MREEIVVKILTKEIEKRNLTYRKECTLPAGSRIDIAIFPQNSYKRKDSRENFIKTQKRPNYSILIECKGDSFSDIRVLEQLNKYYREASKTNIIFFALPLNQAKRFAWFFQKINKKIGIIGVFWEGINVLYNPFNDGVLI